ncbi:hypothetical protein OsI_21651 [Oryza sativa Indica Group]|jgi:hypothetical protein|uniref:Uncharacterized protein n=1 Tax=Oryza sativa subsp. indica TaxID=39946 RepID=B8B2P2_ORYSI|nr:hypothetical protein OsI_21651 [Oryza sativa Indica Group]
MVMIAGDGRGWLLPQIVMAVVASAAALALALWRQQPGEGRGGGGPAAILLAAAPYALLLLLLWCLRAFERAAVAGDEAAQGRLRLAVWLLSSALTVTFAARVAPLMHGAAAVLVWAMSAATVSGGFYMLDLLHLTS